MKVNKNVQQAFRRVIGATVGINTVKHSGGSRISHRGGVDIVRGAVDPRGGYVSKILHVKMKESGPVGGGARRARPP